MLSAIRTAVFSFILILGQRDVSVPPGFAGDPEVRYVEQITEKIAHFDIETDTDTSNFATDTGM